MCENPFPGVYLVLMPALSKRLMQNLRMLWGAAMADFDTQHKTHLEGGQRECERVSYFLLDSTRKNRDMAVTPERLTTKFAELYETKKRPSK